MNLAVIGVGHVGLVTAACLADLGHNVVGLDDDAERIDLLRRGGVPFHEPDLPELLEKVTGAGLLRFTSDLADAITDAEVVFVCVGTPPLPGGGPDLRFVERVAVEVAAGADHDLVLVEKSTVPANTGQRLKQVIRREQEARGNERSHVHVASNPEFLREGVAVYDTLNPDRIVYGTASDFARDRLREVYAPLVERTGAPVVETDVDTAELIKHASNAFLATRISFINAVANVCDRVGADVEVVAQGMGMDERIGPKFLSAGLGFGGSCLVPDETVLARQAGRVQLLSMGALWNEVDARGIDGFEVLAWDDTTQTTTFLPLSAVTLRPYAGEIVEVQTKMGRRLRTTVDHPFVVGDGSASPSRIKLARELTTDDWLPLAAGAPVGAAAQERETEILAAVTADAVGRDEVIHRLSPAALEAVRARKAGLPTPRRYDVLRNGTIRLDELAELELSPEGGSESKRLPDEVWTAPPAHQRAVLRGLWDGDGSWSLINGGPSVILEYGTVSRNLADGMLRLLAHHGIVASVRTGRTAKSLVDTYWLRISGADQVESALWLFPDEEADEIRGHVASQTKRIAPAGYRRLAGDTAWLRISALRRFDYRGPVYSLEVPGAHTIVSTNGLVTHNCFPKDVDAFLHLSRNVGYDFTLLEEVARINAGQRAVVLDKLRDELWHLAGKTITLLGAAFKPGTDDLREAPALHVARALLDEGATVRIYDPVALPGVRKQLGDEVETFDDPLAALQGAHAAVVATDWPEIVALDLTAVKAALDYPIVVDGRNCLDPDAAKAAGLRYQAIGRGHLSA